MNIERYIARRYFNSGRYFVAVSTWITIVGVMLGVAVVCFVMSMHNGIEDYRELVQKIESIDGVLAASPFVYSKAAIQSTSAGDGIIVRGIDPQMESRTANIARDIKLGEYTFYPKPVDGDTISGIILGRGLATSLGAFIGQPVVLYAMSGEDLHRNSRPRVKKFYVSALFETGMFEFDGQQAYISLADAQDLFRTGDAATGVHLKLEDIYLAESLAPAIDSILGFRYDVVPWNILHRNLFSWISMGIMSHWPTLRR